MLSTKTPSTKIEFANTLRGIAALMVMFGHYCLIFWQFRVISASLINADPLPDSIQTPDYMLLINKTDPFSYGIFGVAVFFLISGFVIPFSFKSTDWRGFLLGRALRIYPTYAVGLTISISVMLAFGVHYGKQFPFTLDVVLINYFPGLRDAIWVSGIDGVIWTLDVEVKFYLVCALLHRFVGFESTKIFLAPLVLAILAYFISPMVGVALSENRASYGHYYTVAATIQYICFMFIGVAFNYLYRGLIKADLFMTVVVVLFTAMSVICWRANTVPFKLIWTYGAALLTFSTCFTFREKFNRTRVTDFLANISYPLYVVHGVLGYGVLRFVAGHEVPAWLCVAIAMAVSIMVATAIHYAIEKPSHNVGKWLTRSFPTNSERSDTHPKIAT